MARSAAPGPAGTWSGGPVVRTRFGMVAGRADEAGTWSWKGIPYAAPPVGELRWRAPRDPAAWPGARDASRFGGAATQYNPLTGAIAGSEDCLYLNIWRPRDDAADLPVYVWIHGGGNSIGSANQLPDYDGQRVASFSRVVFVSVNYRLGPLGWFALPQLREGRAPEDDSGNYGTLDLVQALRWIRGSIAAFGGDPGTVMIAGESAGAMDVLSLLASPLAAGLFQRALVESGASTTSPLADAEAAAGQALRQLLVRDHRARDDAEGVRVAGAMSPEAVRTYLRSKSAPQVLACFPPRSFGMTGSPSIIRDGYVVPAAGYRVFETGSYGAKVPVVIGSNKEEVKLFQLGDRTISWREPAYQAAAEYASGVWKADGVDSVARRLAGNPDQPPVYAYQFLWGAPDPAGSSVLPGSLGRRLGSFHMLEVPFFLGTATTDGYVRYLVGSRRNEGGRRALSVAMMSYIARFIRTGNPNAPGLATWEPWSNADDGPKSITFDAGFSQARIAMSRVEYTRESVRAALQSAWPPAVADRVLARKAMPGSDFR